MVMFLVLLVIVGLIAFAVKTEATPIDLDTLGERIPLHVPEEEFFKRYELQVVQSQHYFHGIRKANGEFLMHYRTPGGVPYYYEERLKLHGKVLEGEVAYQFSGDLEDARSEKNKQRLLQKLHELCAADAPTA